jgi:serine/threonine-protein kinase
MSAHASSSTSRNRGRVAKTTLRPVSNLLGQTLDGRYRLDAIIGSGGMGTVYRATHVTIGKTLAVKVLAQEFAGDDMFRRRFLREAQAVSQISHHNVVEVSDFGVTPTGSLYLVMEFLEGESLSDMLDREGGLGWARAKPLVLQVCRALQSAHDKGILHRDVKPENCMRIARSDNPDFIKVLDFGLAKMLMAEAGVDVSLSIKGGGIMGTPEYMSPERIRGQTLDARSDVYALGVLAYELITGCVPYSGDHYTKVLDQQLNAAPVPLRKVSPSLDIGKGIEAVVLRALEKQPEGRFASAGEFADALERAETPAASPHAADTGAASRERTYRVIIVTLVVLVFVLSTVLLGQTFGWL